MSRDKNKTANAAKTNTKMKDKKYLQAAVVELIADLKKPENAGQEIVQSNYTNISFKPSANKNAPVNKVIDVVRAAVFHGVQNGYSTMEGMRKTLKEKGLEGFSQDFEDLAFKDLEAFYKKSEILSGKAAVILTFCASRDKNRYSLQYFVNSNSASRDSNVLGSICQNAIAYKEHESSIDSSLKVAFDKLDALKKGAKDKLENM